MTKKKMFKKSAFLGMAAVAAFGLASCNNEDDGTATYTYSGVYQGDIANWSPLDWQTNADSIILSYVTDSFYNFDFNEDRTSYEVVPGMASELPTDVTNLYAGNEKYGIPAGTASSRAYRVKLRENLTFDDGDAITADDVIESYKQLVDTNASNYRATTYETGTLVIAGSSYYKYAGQTVATSFADVAKYDGKDVSALVEEHKDEKARTNWVNLGYVVSATQQEGMKLDSSSGYYYRTATNDDDKVQETEFTVTDFITMCTKFFGGGGTSYALLDYAYDDVSFEDKVGIVKVDDYTFDVVCDVPISQFYFEYGIGSLCLIDTELYETTKGEASETGSYTSTYCTSVSTTPSFGPYKLTEYIDNKGFKLEKNEAWYGWSLPENEGYYQTTHITYERIDESSTQLQKFLKGELTEVVLDSTTVTPYLTSDSLLQTPETFTMEFFVNTQETMLKALDDAGTTTSAQLLTYTNFRKAMSLGIDRTAFANTVSAGCQPEAMLLNNLYISDPETGEVYRTTTAAQDAFKETYAGATTVSETYNPTEAASLMKKVYDAAVADGKYTPGAAVKFNIGVTNDSSEYQKLCDTLESSLQAILDKCDTDHGTNFGTVEIVLVPDGSNRYANLLQGKYCFIWGAWGGSSLAPHSFFQVYFDNDYNYCPGFNGETELVTLTITGEAEQTMSYYEWFTALNEGKYATADAAIRNEILGKLESAFLQEYTIIPMYALTDFSLTSKQVKLGTDTYVTVMGFGGIKYMTYEYSDQKWAEYIDEHADASGNLDYTE